MTKVELPLALREPLNSDLLARIADVHSTYGIFRVRVDNGRGGLVVEYDATRLSPKEVRAVLAGAGIPVRE